MAHNEPSHLDLTVCHSVTDFSLKPLFDKVDVSNFRDGRFHFRNSGMKGLMLPLTSREQGVQLYHSVYQTFYLVSKTTVLPVLDGSSVPPTIQTLPQACGTSLVNHSSTFM